MQENYLISIIGQQIVDGEKEEIRLTTVGSYIKKGTTRYILYNEYSSDIPSSKVTSVLKIDSGDKVTLIRSGNQRSRLILEKGKRHLCHYDTGFGSMMIGVFANRIKSELSDSGGHIDINYSLDINSGLASINQISVTIKEAKNKDVKNTISGDQQP